MMMTQQLIDRSLRTNNTLEWVHEDGRWTMLLGCLMSIMTKTKTYLRLGLYAKYYI